jgi:hypothetical protein
VRVSDVSAVRLEPADFLLSRPRILRQRRLWALVDPNSQSGESAGTYEGGPRPQGSWGMEKKAWDLGGCGEPGDAVEGEMRPHRVNPG